MDQARLVKHLIDTSWWNNLISKGKEKSWKTSTEKKISIYKKMRNQAGVNTEDSREGPISLNL